MIGFMDLDFHATESGTEAWIDMDGSHVINIAMYEMAIDDKWSITASGKDGKGIWKGIELDCFNGSDKWSEHNLRKLEVKMKEAQAEMAKVIARGK